MAKTSNTETVRALVVRDPWAEQIEKGEKTEEFRCWRTHYRGPLLIIVASRPKSLASGTGICIVDVVDCVERGPKDFVWKLANVRSIDPIPMKGRLGIFAVEIDITK